MKDRVGWRLYDVARSTRSPARHPSRVCRGVNGDRVASATAGISSGPRPPRCENQSCVMNWIQNAPSTLKSAPPGSRSAQRSSRPAIPGRRCSGPARDWMRVKSSRLMSCGSGFASARRSPCRLRASSLRPSSGNVESNWNVPRERLVRRAHAWIADVVAGAVHVAEPDQFAAAELHAIAAYGTVQRMLRRQPHLRPTP